MLLREVEDPRVDAIAGSILRHLVEQPDVELHERPREEREDIRLATMHAHTHTHTDNARTRARTRARARAHTHAPAPARAHTPIGDHAR